MNVIHYTNKQLDVIKLVHDGKAFVNPYASIINEIIAAIGTTKAGLEPAYLPTEALEIEETLDTFQSSLNSFKIHVDRVSGVNMVTGSLPNVHNLLAVSRSIETVYRSMRKTEEETIERSQSLFYSLFHIDLDLFAFWKSFILSIVPRATSSSSSKLTPAEIENVLGQAGPLLSNAIAQDNGNYSSVIDELKEVALMYELVSLTGTIENDVVNNKIGSPELVNLLKE